MLQTSSLLMKSLIFLSVVCSLFPKRYNFASITRGGQKISRLIMLLSFHVQIPTGRVTMSDSGHSF